MSLLRKLQITALFAISLLMVLFLSPVQANALEVRAGLEQNPPLSFIDEQGQPAGLLVDLLDYVAERSGWQVTYVPDTFANCLQKLTDHDIDLMVTIAYSNKRAELYDYNQINIVANWGVLYSAGKKDIQSYLDLEGATVAVMSKDTHHRAFRAMLTNFGISANYLELDNFEQVFTTLSTGQADVGVVGRFYALGQEASSALTATPIIFNPIKVHYATAKGMNTHLLQTLDENLKQLKGDPASVYYFALDRWLGVLGKSSIPGWLWPGFMALIALLLLAGGFMALLKRQVTIRTKKLNEEIAKRTAAQQELMVAEQNYRTLVEEANAIILRWDQRGDITYINDFGETLFGYEKGELIGKNVTETIVPELSTDGQNLIEMIRAICEHPEDFKVNENENVTKSGERVWISWRNQPVYGQDGDVEGILSVGQDITAKKQAEQSRLQYDQAKDTFISSAAHELRTPLTVMIGYAELLSNPSEAESFSPQQRQEFLETITIKGTVLSRIVDDLLDVSRIQKGQALPLRRIKTSFGSLVEQVCKEFQTLSPSHIFRVNVHEEVGSEQLFDPERITQVFENLFSNALKYSAQGSEIVTSIVPEGPRIHIVVADQGIGMTEEQVAKIFADFYRVDTSHTAVNGLGLGMCIVQQIVLAHGGEIWVESTPDVGTKVHFTLPNGTDRDESVAGSI